MTETTESVRQPFGVVISSSHYWTCKYEGACVQELIDDLPEPAPEHLEVIVDMRLPMADSEIIWDEASFRARYDEQARWNLKASEVANGRPIWSGPADGPCLFQGSWHAEAKKVETDTAEEEWAMIVQDGYDSPIFNSKAQPGKIIGCEMARSIAEAIIAASETAWGEAQDIYAPQATEEPAI